MEAIAVNVTEAAKLIGISKSRLYELVAEGSVPARKIGFRTVFIVDELREFLKACPTL